MSQPFESASAEVQPQEQVQPPTPVISPPTAQVAALQIKLPLFWLQDPQLWFAKIEAQFMTCQITISRTKFGYVHDLLLNPPDETPYEVLKMS